MGKKPTTVDEYLEALTEDQRGVVMKLRKAILAMVPRAEEGISYGIPVVRLEGQPVVWFAAWKKHYSLYPVTSAMLEAHGAEIEKYETSKGTIRFPASQPVPYDLAEKLVKVRLAEMQGNLAGTIGDIGNASVRGHG